MRLGACSILRQLSEVLGKYQIGLVSHVIGPLIELMLVRQYGAVYTSTTTHSR
jgi:hypothetical protein